MNGIQDCLKSESVQNANPPTGIAKKCTKCGENKPLSDFIKDSRNVRMGGLGAICKVCSYKGIRQWWIANPELCAEYSRKWRRVNPERAKKLGRIQKAKRNSSIKGRISNSTSAVMTYALKNKGGKGRIHWEEITGYDIKKLMQHLKRHFLPGMTWENYGVVWEVDHIIPITAFNFSSRDDLDFKGCWALSNLRPLWKTENRKKSNKLSLPFQPSLLINAKSGLIISLDIQPEGV